MEDIDKLIEEMEASKPAGNCFWRHKWTVWSKPYSSPTRYWAEREGRYYMLDVLKQKSVCLACGKVKIRKVY